MMFMSAVEYKLLLKRVTSIAVVIMEPKGRLFVCLVVSVTMAYVVLGANEGHGSLCRSNERFLPCGGCQKTCIDPAPECAGVCRTGCYCNEGEVRNDTGHCVKLSECPPVALSALLSTEPRVSGGECPADEEYRSCEPCNRTCDNPNPICPAQCARGCFCRDDLVRDTDGRCVHVENCSNVKNNEISNKQKPIPYQLTCGPHQVYSSCRSCERTCSSPIPACSLPCSAGCFCEDGYLKAPSGKCVKLEDCPRAEISLGGAQEPSIEDCSSDEIYLSCGWCEPSCWEPRPECPRGVCTRGCLCRPPLLRHHSGHCVQQRDCKPHKCPDLNEEFVCRYGCEARCDTQKCKSRPRRCVLGCHCRLGLLRDVNGKCVAPNNCQEPAHTFNITESKNNNTLPYNASETTETPALNVEGSGKINLVEVPILHQSVFDAVDSESNTRRYNDVVSRAVKIYKEMIDTPNPYREIYYIPRSFKDLAMSKGFGEDLTTKNLKAREASPFFTQESKYKDENDKNYNYMNDIVTSLMKEMKILPSTFNLTLDQHPMWVQQN